MLPKVSIIIPVYNEERLLGLCLDAVMKLEYPAELREVIVVDNASTDKSADVIRSFPVQYLFEGKKGRSAARNAGLRVATGEIAAFTDADAVPDPHWLLRLVEGFDHPDVGVCGGKNASLDPKNILERYFGQEYEGLAEGDDTYFESYLTGALFAASNLACRRAAAEEAGFFDETLAACEDIDLVWKINLSGRQVKYVEDAVVFHKRRGTLAELPELCFTYASAQYRLIKKYEPLLGTSFSWGGVTLKVLASLCSAPVHAATGRFDKSCFDVFTAFLAAMQLTAAAYVSASGRGSGPLSAPSAPQPVIWRWDSNGDVMVLNLKYGAGYRLKGPAGTIWERWARGMSPERIAEALEKEYGVSREKALADTLELIGQLQDEDTLPVIS